MEHKYVAEIINVLNYIGEKIGIAIDWTAENVWPQVLDILGRYRIFQIVGYSIWLVVFAILAVVFIHFGKPFVNNYKSCSENHKDNFWFDYSNYWSEIKWRAPSCVYLTLLIVYLAFVLVGTPIIISEMLEWIFIPEIQYLEMLKAYI